MNELEKEILEMLEDLKKPEVKERVRKNWQEFLEMERNFFS